MFASAVNAAIEELADLRNCPACGAHLGGPVCGHCQLDLSGPRGVNLARESQAAAAALRRRQFVLGRLAADCRALAVPRVGGIAVTAPGGGPMPPPGTVSQAGPAPQLAAPTPPWAGPTNPFGPAGQTRPAADPSPLPDGVLPRPIPPQAWQHPPAPRPSGQPTPTAIFAVVGAGLIAAAAVVLAFSATELALWLRQGILIVTTLAAVGAVLALRRRAMAASTQAFGALSGALAVTGMILIAQNYVGFTTWRVAAALCGALAIGFGLLGFRLQVRAWVTTAAVLAPIPPLLLAGTLGSLPDGWGLPGAAGLCLVVTAIAALRHLIAGWWKQGRLQFEQVWLTLAAAGGLAGASLAMVVHYAPGAGPGQWTVTVGFLAAAGAGLIQGRLRPGPWTWFAGALLVGAGASLVPPGSFGGRGQGLIVPAVAGILAWAVVTATAWIPGRDWARARSVYTGAWVAGLVVAVPSLGAYLAAVFGPLGLIADRGVDARIDQAPFISAASWPTPILWVALPAALLVVMAGPLLLAGRGIWKQAAPAGGGSGGVLSQTIPGPGTPGRPIQSFGPTLVGAPPTGPFGPAVASVRQSPTSPCAMWSIARVVVGPMAVIVACCFATLPGLAAWGSFGLALAVVIGAWTVAERLRRGAAAGKARPAAWAWLRWPLVISGAVVLVWAVAMSWGSRPTELVIGGVGVALTLGAQVMIKPAGRPVLVAIGYVYGLVLLVAGLIWYPIQGAVRVWEPVATVPALVAAVVSIAVVWIKRIGRGARGVVLAVSLVPWVAAIVSTAVARTWWAAAAALALGLTQLVVVGLNGRPIAHPVRLMAAATLVPTGCVVVINAGAQVITGSGSPVLLPVVTVLAAVGAIGSRPWARRMARAGRGADQAEQLRRAVELSALVTVVLATALSITRSATTATTTLIVCAIAGAAASALAWQADRRGVWWIASLAYCGVLWSALALGEVGLVEAYTAPPGLAGLVVSLAALRRRPAWRGLTVCALSLLIVPSLVLSLFGYDASGRAAALTAGAAVLVAAGMMARRRPRWRVVVGGVGWMAGLAGLAPALAAGHVLGRYGSVARPADDWFSSAYAQVFGRQDMPWAPTWLVEAMTRSTTASFATAVVLIGLAGGLVAAGGWLVKFRAAGGAPGHSTTWGRLVESTWAFPGVVVAASGPIMAVRFTWVVEIVMLVLTLAVIGAAIKATQQRVVGHLTLPPPLLLWLVALAIGIAGWSMRQVRVEAYSLPLGVGLLICGLIALRAQASPKQAPGAWPVGNRNPGQVLVPGQLAILGPSTLAIATDPATIRAVAVVVMALIFMLVAARQLWTACMTVAVADLAVAILIVFTARRDAISTMPWLLTLAGAGGILLTLAMYQERKRRTASGQPDSVKAVE